MSIPLVTQIKFLVFYLLVSYNYWLEPVAGRRSYDRQQLLSLREAVREMFQHAYNGYLKYAYPYDELRPLTCDGIDTWGSYSLTLIDALDTLAVMGNYSEFRRVVGIITTNANFDANINVSVFETNIRIVGGLLGAHLLSQRAGLDLEPGWPCNGPLLRLAEDVAKRLLAAFDTPTGMPYGTVNLRYGVPPGETPITCTAGIGTFILEFGALSRLTGDPVYEEVALNALHSLYKYRSSIGLFGNHIDVVTGRWTAQDSGIGAGVDSYFEYLVKGSMLLQRPELKAMFNHIRLPIDKYLKKNNWYVWASMHKGQVTIPVFQSLEAYWPGVLSLIGDIENAQKLMRNYNSVWKQYGFTPEFYNIAQGEAGNNRESYPLRPELVESAMYLYQATRDPYMLDIGVNILRSIQHSAKTPCGYATIKDTRDHTQENRMESFFLAETTKYLYLLFDTDNFLHNKGQSGRVHSLPSGKQCLLDAGGYILNTEAHPIDPGALNCCYETEIEELNIHARQGSYKGESLRGKKITALREKNTEDITKGTTQSKVESTKLEKPAPVPDNDSDNEEVGTVGTIEAGQRPNEKKPETEELSLETSMEKAKFDLSNSKQVLNQVLSIMKDRKEMSGDIQSILEEVEIEDQGEEEKPPNPPVEEDEPTFHQEQTGQTTENTSKNPFVVDGDWNSEKISFQIDDDQATPAVRSESEKIAAGGAEVTTLPELVKQLVMSVSDKPKFDPQQLLEKIRNNRSQAKTHVWDSLYELLTCKAQPFLIRITMTEGEFISIK